MADVTISQLTQGTPNGSNLLPYSTGSSTLGVPVSAIFQNTNSVGIGTSSPLYKLDIRDNSNVAGINLEGNQDNVAIRLNNNQTGGRSYRIISTALGSGYGTGSLAFEDQNGARMIINSSGAVTKPNQPFLHATMSSNNISTPSGYRYINYNFSGDGGPLVPYNTIKKQNGDNFNTSTYRYTIPVSGVYNITAGVFAGDINGNPAATGLQEAWLVVDGVRNITITNSNSNTGTSPMAGILHGSANFYFNANQTVGIKAHGYGSGSGSILTEQTADYHTFLTITLLG